METLHSVPANNLLASHSDSSTPQDYLQWLSYLNEEVRGSECNAPSSEQNITVPVEQTSTGTELSSFTVATTQDQDYGRPNFQVTDTEQDFLMQAHGQSNSDNQARNTQMAAAVTTSSPGDVIAQSSDPSGANTMNTFPAPFPFNWGNYPMFQMPHIFPGNQQPVTTQPQSVFQAVPQNPVMRVPQPTHLISPLLAQSHPQVPTGLRNSNYLMQPIIARPSSNDNHEATNSENLNGECSSPQSEQDHLKSEDPKTDQKPDISTIPIAANGNHSQLHHTMQFLSNVNHPMYSNNVTQSYSPVSDTSVTAGASDFAVPKVEESTDPKSDFQEPRSVSSSYSDDSPSNEDNSDELSNIDSPPEILQAKSSPAAQHQSHGVNFWEQTVSSANIAASGLAHPKPVRISNSLPQMFNFPWVNGIDNFRPAPVSQSLPSHQSEAKQQSHQSQPPTAPSLQESTEDQSNSTSGSIQQSNPFRFYDSHVIKSEPTPGKQEETSHVKQEERPQQHPVQTIPQYNTVGPCLSPDQGNVPASSDMFSSNTFMSPSFFLQPQLSMNQMPPFSSTPQLRQSPDTGKTSDDDSAIDLNTGSSNQSPTSSISSRGSPELVPPHLPCNEDSCSSLSDTSLVRPNSSLSSIYDSSLSSSGLSMTSGLSTNMGMSNTSCLSTTTGLAATTDLSTSSSLSSATDLSTASGITKGKRPNSDPDVGLVKKKTRFNYSPGHLRALERVYMENPYPECDTIDRLSRELEIPDSRLRVWFQNKRARMRRMAKQNKQAGVNPYATQPMSAIISASQPYPILPGNPMVPTSQGHQMPRSYYPYPHPQSHPGAMMPQPGMMPPVPGLPQAQPPALSQQQSQIQRLYSFIAHKQH